MLKRFEAFTFLIKKINRDIQKIKLMELKKFGLKGSQMDFIYCLGKNKTLTFKGFCENLKLDKAFVSRNIVLLKKDKLIEESIGECNKSVYKLSKKGKEIFDINKKTTEKICNTVYIDNDKVEEFYKNLIDISNKLQRIGDVEND